MLLVDASVWVALASPTERFHRDATALVESSQPLAALDLTLFEIANAVGVKMDRPRRAQRIGALLFRRCGDRLVRVDEGMIAPALEIAGEHGLTAYDAAYVAAARRHGWTLVSAGVRDLVHRDLAITPDAALYP